MAVTSQKVAIRAAWRRVKLRELTDVEKEFATSLAPILNASAKAKTMPSAKMYVYCGSAGIRNEPPPPFEIVGCENFVFSPPVTGKFPLVPVLFHMHGHWSIV